MKNNRGFSLVELAVTMVVGISLTAMALPLIESSIRLGKADAGLNLVTTQLRVARQLAVDKRRTHRVSFGTVSGTVAVEMLAPGGQWQTVISDSLPNKVEFRVESGLPTTTVLTPDRMGAGSAVDFNGSNVINFQSTGSAVDSAGNFVNGIVYLAYPGYADTARAVTLFGSTGRIRAWRIEGEGEGWKWN